MAKPCGFAIEFNPFRNTSLVPVFLPFLHPQWRAPRRFGRWGGGCRAAPVPSPRRTTTVLWGGEGGPGAGALVQAALSRRSTRRSPPQKAVGPPAAPHAQPMRVQRTARPSGPISAPAARRGTASPVPRPTTSQSHRGVVVWAKNQHACAKTRGSFVETCQGNKYRLTGKTSEAVFVSFVWVNSCRKKIKKSRNPLRGFELEKRLVCSKNDFLISSTYDCRWPE
jgi:hypothetical protein